jgi:alanyl-tRNA synthetase
VAILPMQPDELRVAAEETAKRHPGAIVALGCVYDGRAHLFIKVPSALTKEGLNAGVLLQKAMGLIEGHGGGKAESAQGAGKAVDKLQEALEAIVAACVS